MHFTLVVFSPIYRHKIRINMESVSKRCLFTSVLAQMPCFSALTQTSVWGWDTQGFMPHPTEQ